MYPYVDVIAKKLNSVDNKCKINVLKQADRLDVSKRITK